MTEGMPYKNFVEKSKSMLFRLLSERVDEKNLLVEQGISRDLTKTRRISYRKVGAKHDKR